MELEQQPSSSPSAEDVTGTLSIQIMAALQREETHCERIQELTSLLKESHAAFESQNQMCLKMVDMLRNLSLSSHVLAAAAAAPSSVRLTSIVQTGKSFFRRARARSLIYPSNLEEWDIASEPLLNPKRRRLTQAELLRLCYAVTAVKLPTDVSPVSVASLCYMMTCKLKEVTSSSSLEVVDRLLATDDVEAFWKNFEGEKAPTRVQPFRVAGKQRS